MDKIALSVPETAKVLGISTNSCYSLIHQADFPSVKIGGRWIVPVTGLNQWLIEQSKKEKAL